MTADDRCGTVAGYSAHRRRKEEPCAPCRGAHVAYGAARIKAGIDKRSPKTERGKAYVAAYTKARGRALSRLAKEHPERFRQLLAEERDHLRGEQ